MPHQLWDLPTRVFHWSLVGILPLAWWSAEQQNYDLHQWLGYTLIVLVVARILWGFVGSQHSRFSDFLVGPQRLLAYLRRGTFVSAGHNPLGGLSVLALLTLLLLQAVSGLFNADDILYSGPLYYAASDTLRGVMAQVHDWVFDGLLVLIGLHIAAVLYHQLRLKEKLLQAMWRGRVPGREGQARPVAWWWALLLVAVLALALYWGLAQAPQPPPTRWF